jgi:hypothetical protein
VSLNGFVNQPVTVRVNGVDWHLFDIQFETPDGTYSVYMYAISDEHARLMLADLKLNGKVTGQVLGSMPADGDPLSL